MKVELEDARCGNCREPQKYVSIWEEAKEEFELVKARVENHCCKCGAKLTSLDVYWGNERGVQGPPGLHDEPREQGDRGKIGNPGEPGVQGPPGYQKC